jgi:hypothetical protein
MFIHVYISGLKFPAKKDWLVYIYMYVCIPLYPHMSYVAEPIGVLNYKKKRLRLLSLQNFTRTL